MEYHKNFVIWTKEQKSITNHIKSLKNNPSISSKGKTKLNCLIKRKMKIDGLIKGYKMAQGFYQNLQQNQKLKSASLKEKE